MLRYFISLHITASSYAQRICLLCDYLACTGLSISGSCFPPVSPQFCYHAVQEYQLLSIGYAFQPDLRSRLPRADQLYPGDLGYSATRILTLFSLLIPAFSLLSTPQLLTVLLLRVKNAPLPMTMSFLSFGGMF